MTHVHSRLSSDVCLFSICRATFIMRRQAWRDISSNLTKATHQIWRKRLIKLDERDIILSILTKTSSHQTWNRRLIKFLKRKTISLFFDERFHATTRDMKSLVLQKITFVLRENRNFCKNVIMISNCFQSIKAQHWYNSTFFHKRKTSSYVKAINK